MRLILVATDLAPPSDRALRRATLLAAVTGAGLVLLHVARDEDEDEGDRARTVEELARLTTAFDGVACEPLFRTGGAVAGINAVAEAVDADLVVLGPPQWRLGDLFTGSTAGRTVRGASRPILVVRGVPRGAYRQSLLATDLSPPAGTAAETAQRLRLLEAARVAALTVVDDPMRGLLAGTASPAAVDLDAEPFQLARAGLAAFARELDVGVDDQIVKPAQGSVAATIVAEARRLRADLLVIGSRGRSALADVLLGSVAQDLLSTAESDLLIVPPA